MTTLTVAAADETLDMLAFRQSNVVTRRQLLALGWTDQRIRTARGRDWQTLHPGVYVMHTGPLTWKQRAWAAVLAAWPAALCRTSGLPDAPRRSRDGVIHVAVRNGHRVRSLKGVVVHEMFGFEGRLVPGSPPRIRLEECLLDLVREERDAWGEIAVLCDAVQQGLTTPRRLVERLDDRLRVRHRDFLRAVLLDIANGTHSALEQAYLVLVERAHDLPVGERQVRSARTNTARDVVYRFADLAVELDGRGFHTALHDWQRDLSRDLLALLEDDLQTVRLSWKQVVGSPCRTAAQMARLLQSRGWDGRLVRCSQCPDSL